jgi:hypothetical protein
VKTPERRREYFPIWKPRRREKSPPDYGHSPKREEPRTKFQEPRKIDGGMTDKGKIGAWLDLAER